MAASGGQKSDKLDEAQALARSCAGRPDFLPCDGLSICATHSHGKCFKLHWCCHLGWCHCKYVYQPMTNVCHLPSTPVPVTVTDHAHTMDLTVLLAERFLRTAPAFQTPPCPESPRFCVISDLFVDDYMVKRINGKMCYVQRPHPSTIPSPPQSHPPRQRNPMARPKPQLTPVQQLARPRPQGNKPSPLADKVTAPKMDHCSSPSSSEDSGINALGSNFLESCDEGSEEEEEADDLSSDGGDSSPGSMWDQDECSLLSPSKSMVEIIEKIETTV
ncbi:hypothetical protein DPEC_G00147810 [Dallia pectoralis]|uniref:Uncharacterized protein n=1 Tax=Dallia pectoralis TaxID=75939 RepID=A0ACC2GI38_DALPE|nr:hypothetical protein DPEC_G00147810 [Dallia pectoralis]